MDVEQATLVLAYMDDFAIPLESSRPARLLRMLLSTAAAISKLAGEFGMEANFRPGKTEAIVVLRGRGTAEAQRGLSYDANKIGRLQVSDGNTLRIVST